MKTKLFCFMAISFLLTLKSLGQSWLLAGNSFTNPNIDYLGTTDFTQLTLKTNATTRGFLSPNGNLHLLTPSSIGLPNGNKEGVLNLTQNWGDWLKFKKEQDGGIWGIHNPQIGEGLEFYYNDVSNNSFIFSILKLRTDGKVQIGSDIQSFGGNYKLYVQNGILTEKVKVALKNTSDWSDFVFAKNYKLRPLSEVEKFIKKYKHLPDVPSATSVVKNGIDLAKMDATLLQKIEELTLYMIELKKENIFLRKEIEALKK